MTSQTTAPMAPACRLTARQRDQVQATRCPRCGARAVTPARLAEPCAIGPDGPQHHLERLQAGAQAPPAQPELPGVRTTVRTDPYDLDGLLEDERIARFEHEHREAIAEHERPPAPAVVRRCRTCGCTPGVAPCRPSLDLDRPGCSWAGNDLCTRCA